MDFVGGKPGFIFQTVGGVPLFFFFPPAQVFTKWPPRFLGRNTTDSARRCCVRGPVVRFRGDGGGEGRGAPAWGVNRDGFYRHFCACGGFASTKESCDFGAAAILSRLSGRGLVLASRGGPTPGGAGGRAPSGGPRRHFHPEMSTVLPRADGGAPPPSLPSRAGRCWRSSIKTGFPASSESRCPPGLGRPTHERRWPPRFCVAVPGSFCCLRAV